MPFTADSFFNNFTFTVNQRKINISTEVSKIFMITVLAKFVTFLKMN